MKYLKLTVLLIISSAQAFSQNWPACDSLDISCCEYNVFGPNTITITVTNNSSVLFDYPSFILFNSNMDTVAIETVTYFGIGSNPQPHTMNITGLLSLPFSGYLNLYSLFNDTLACSFTFTIPDTSTQLSEINESIIVKVRPNPVLINGKAEIQIYGLKPGVAILGIADMTGREIEKRLIEVDINGNSNSRLNINFSGQYFISVNQDGVFQYTILSVVK